MQIQLVCPGPPEKNTRYDQEFREKFDFKRTERVMPISPAFSLMRRFVQEQQVYDDDLENVSIPDKIKMADIALRLRGLAGVLFGSTVRKIYDYPKSSDKVATSTDLDVLILNPHSRRHPAPFEWGIDWFVRPPNSYPTNSNVKIVYDLFLKPGYFCYSNDRFRKLDEERAVCLCRQVVEGCLDAEQDDGAIMRQSAKVSSEKAILPGLYLPERQTMEAIATRCNHIRATEPERLQFDSYNYLIPENAVPMGEIELPVMPHTALLVK